MSGEFFAACERLLSATANGVYQGMLVALLAGLVLQLFARTNAATRHAVWFGVLLFVAALIPAHLLLSLRPRPELSAPTSGPASRVAVIALAPSYAGDTANGFVADSNFPVPQRDESNGCSAEDNPSSSGPGIPRKWENSATGSQGRPSTASTKNSLAAFEAVILNSPIWNSRTALSLPHSICLCAVLAWALLASVRGGLIARSISEVRRAKTMSGAPSARLQDLFDGLRGSLATRRDVRLRISSAHRTAVVLGFFHPVVLLPEEMDDDADHNEVEHVLRHELAHVARKDDWANLAQQLIQAALFFHPALWWISKRLFLEREIACDDHVLEASARPRAYALTLANIASRMNHSRQLLAPGVSNNNSQLQQRITMILNMQRNRSPRLARRWLGVFITATAMFAVLAIDAGPRFVLAQSPSVSPPASVPVYASSTLAPDAPVAIAPPIALPPDAAVVSADAPPAALPPDSSGNESGPRYKPSYSDGDSAPTISSWRSVPATPAAPPVPPVAAVAGVAPVPEVPDAPPAPRGSKRHASVEERLDRIERILEDLEAHGKMKGYSYSSSDGYSVYGRGNGQGMAYGLYADPTRTESASKRAAVQAQRAEADALRAERAGQLGTDQATLAMEANQRAMEAAQRTLEESQRANERAARELELKSRDPYRPKEEWRKSETEGSVKALQVLRDARETLQTQIRNLERQIQRLEEDQKKSKKTGRTDDSDKEESAPAKTS